MAHGCNHAATDFFPRSRRCPKCAGLPEETALAGKALERGYVVVAVSSAGRCWGGAADGARVKRAIDAVVAKNVDLPGKPVFAFGASSGGTFVGFLPFVTAVDGVIAQISSVHVPKLADKASLAEELRAQGGRGDFPPIVFSHMVGGAAVRVPRRSFFFSSLFNDPVVEVRSRYQVTVFHGAKM